MTKVLVGIISMNDVVYTDFMRSILHLDTSELEVDYFFTGHSITSAARNVCAAKAVGEGYDYLAFFDTDMVLHSQTLKRLLSHDVDIVSGMYRARRGEPGPFFAFRFDDTGVPKTIGQIDMSEGSPELMEVHGVATGCLLIKTSVFTRLDDRAAATGAEGPSPGQPYFFYAPRLDRLVLDQEHAMYRQSSGNRFVDADVTILKSGFGRGEDLEFCSSCCNAGIKIHLDTRLVAGHLATRSTGVPALYD